MFAQIFDKKNQIDKDLNFQKKKLFPSEEVEFFQRLQKALPNCIIFPHLPLSSLIQADNLNEKKCLNAEKILSHHVIDFSIFSYALELLCIIELESNHSDNPEGDDRIQRQASHREIIEKAGIPSIRWNKNHLPTFDQMLRFLAPYSTLSAPKAELRLSDPHDETFTHLRNDASKPNVDLKALPEHHNPDALSLRFLRDLTPNNFIQREYPHIWQRICLFAGEPSHLKNYLESLFVQNRPVDRKGLPQHVVNEVIVIQIENNRFVENENDTVWSDDLIKK